MSGTVRASLPLLHPGYKAGTGTYPMIEGPVTTAAIPAADKLYLYPFILYSPITFTAGQMRVGTGGAGSSVKVGIWANSPVSNRPLGAPLFADNTGVATTSNSTNVAPALAGSLAPGVYWSGAKFTGTLPQMVIIPGSNVIVARLAGYSGGSLILTGLSIDDAYSNDLPTIAEGATFTALSVQSVPVLGLTT